MAEQTSAYTVFDVSRSGNLDVQGNIVSYLGDEAVIQALRNWVASAPGDTIRQPDTGGRILSQLLKPMNSVTDLHLESVLRDSLYKDFKPDIEIVDLNIQTDVVKRQRTLYLRVFSKSLNTVSVLNEKLRVE